MTKQEIIDRVKAIQDQATADENTFLTDALAQDPTTIPPAVVDNLLAVIAQLQALLLPPVLLKK